MFSKLFGWKGIRDISNSSFSLTKIFQVTPPQGASFARVSEPTPLHSPATHPHEYSDDHHAEHWDGHHHGDDDDDAPFLLDHDDDF
jgi:hypothetical protein